MPTASKHWRSLDDLAATPEFQELVRREFHGRPFEALPPASRRQFLKVMGASMALAGLAACRWPSEEIVPFAHRPEDRTPGVPQRFATALELGGAATGMVVTSLDGRPIKVDGNPGHPDSLGAASARHQAAVLELYDPDRSADPLERSGERRLTRTWADVEAAVGGRLDELAGSGGTGLAVLATSSSSPTLARLRRLWQERFPEATWYEHEPLSRDAERSGARLVFGRPLRRLMHLDAAEVVVALDDDPLLEHPAALRLAHDLAASRRLDQGAGHGRSGRSGHQMSRLYAAECTYSVTGAMADHRLGVPRAAIPAVLVEVIRLLETSHGIDLPEPAAALLREVRPLADGGRGAAFTRRLAADLASHRGRSAILVGPSQAPVVHALGHLLDLALGNHGTVVELVELVELDDPDRPTHVEAISSLAASLRAGQVETLVILGGNPVYDAPADLELGTLIGKAALSIHLGLYDDETSQACTWHLPEAHALESWGDGRAWDGTLTLQQPLIAPLYGGRTATEVVALMLGRAGETAHDLVAATFRALGGPGVALDAERAWRQALHDGVVQGTARQPVEPRLAADGLGQALRQELEQVLEPAGDAGSGHELSFIVDAKVFDGRFANNAWLQELPGAVTKITWDNAALLSPVTAHELGLADGDMVRVETGDAAIELPVVQLPGQARGTVSIALGYGRRAAGQVGTGVGVDVYALRRSNAMHAVQGVSLRPTGARRPVACTQDHHAIDEVGFAERGVRVGALVREATLTELVADPDVIHHHGHHAADVDLWKPFDYGEGEQWGMVVDLSSCIGCNACVTACQAENNVPVVGREQVLNGREMQWIRIDRYFKTSDPAHVRPEQVEDAEIVFQPVTCMHCETAPCEQVCPVAATQHTADGLNAMVYNRCVGTRYCSNNCPFKVRRFNFFDYHGELEPVQKMLFNPEVTVRSRGVMEKCTFCVQRIEAARIAARRDGRLIADGEVVPACAQTCPTQAITFGNLNDPASRIAAAQKDHRTYAMLSELKLDQRLRYQARIRNPQPDPAAAAAAAGTSTEVGGGEPASHLSDHGKETA